ncbi:hypothetical protein OSH93_00020 [Mycobacterium ulcerans]|uniref:putative alpha/beta hydrolase n=1 Tax=Mycobacterium ulcerans TaxID=1809 RepID=UPI0012DF4540|nr:hypothetical protein [Mycobacterium ulcerans]MEB3967335.1 hypothetical protein [Mycobacterium ulcerans]MEB3975689.1 hypothetical protein [Mycobacterium ulcerans]MEB4005056.1 hypothetical protein [Mycobacterium ulcerans]MEB4414540.1 hypothetical protein [Mycobacterium ulcerans]MEB4432590.1 hypothetical protein [Mycobacterium ulcerans]
MHLRHISQAALITFAGGDPWKINATLQSGRPAQISDLAQAFHDAGQSTAEADTAFRQARERFEKSWTHETGENPINDSAEVRRTVTTLGVQAAQLPKIAADLQNVAATLAEAQRSGKSALAALEDELHRIDDQLDEALQLERDPNLTRVERDLLEEYITGCEQEAIDKTRAAIGDLERIRDDYAGKLQQAESNLHTDGYDTTLVAGLDGHTPETPQQAEEDVHKALAGDKAAAARVAAVLDSITAGQRAGNLPLTPEQASVLSQMQAQQHGMSIDDLKTAEERLDDQRHVIGDSWQLMSTPTISFPKTPLNPGAKERSETVQGGFAQLPESVQRTLTAPEILFADQTRTIADIVKGGNPMLQHSTPLDQNLLHKGAQIMSSFDWTRNTFDPTVEAVFWAAERDHGAVNWMVNDLGMCDAASGDFMLNITHQTWADDGAAAGSLFSWTQNATGPGAGIAGQTAQTYAAYLGQNSHELLDLPGHQTLGQMNPKLVQDFAKGLAPYVANIAGDSNDLSQYFHTPDANQDVETRLPVAKGIFSVLSTDKDASDIFNGAAMRQIMQDQNDYAAAVANHTPGAVAHDADLQQAATLKALVDCGVNNAAHAQGLNGDQLAAEAYARKQSAYGSVVKGLGTGAGIAGGALPPPFNIVGKLSGPGVSMAGNALQQDIIGAPPTAMTTSEIVANMPDSVAYSQVLNGLIANHAPISGLDSDFFVHTVPGDPSSPLPIATYDEYRRISGGGNTFEYNQKLRDAVQGALGDGTVIPHMQNHYNDVVQIPNP